MLIKENPFFKLDSIPETDSYLAINVNEYYFIVDV